MSTTPLVSRGIGGLWKGNPELYVGGLFLGTVIDNLLFGVLMIETWTYFHWFRGDRLKFKALVWGVFLLNAIQTGVTVVYAFIVFIKETGNWETIVSHVNVEFEIILMLEALCTSAAQVFFLERAYKISKKNRYVLGFCSLTILGGLALGLGAAIATITQPTGDSVDFSTFAVLTNLIISWKAVTGLTDVVLTFTIVWFLINSKSGWARTDSTVTSLIRFTCEAQVLPLIAGLFFLGAYVWNANSNLCLIGSFAETKLSAISVTYVLNSRRHDWNGTDRSTERGTSGNATTKGGGRGVTVFTETQIHTSNPGSDDRREIDAQTRSNRHEADGISLESFEQEDAMKRAEEAASSEAYLATLARGPFASEVSFAGTARTNESGMNLVPDNRGSLYRE